VIEDDDTLRCWR